MLLVLRLKNTQPELVPASSCPDERVSVFGKFERGNRPLTRQSGVGAGLGLSLVESFIELHGGSVSIESAEESGTTVICRIPAVPNDNAPFDETTIES